MAQTRYVQPVISHDICSLANNSNFLFINAKIRHTAVGNGWYVVMGYLKIPSWIVTGYANRFFIVFLYPLTNCRLS